jgi:hypothetical protein
MRKTTVSAAALVAVFMAMAVPVQAEDVTSSPRPLRTLLPIRKEIRNDRQEIRAEVRAKTASKSMELKGKSEQKRKDAAKKFWSNVTNRLSKLLAGEVKLADRIAKRLDEFASKGKDVTSQKAALVTARASIVAAQQSVKDAGVQVDAILADATLSAKDMKAKLQDIHKGLLEKIRLSHKQLVDVVVSIRAVKASPSVSPSPVQ